MTELQVYCNMKSQLWQKIREFIEEEEKEEEGEEEEEEEEETR